MQTDRKEFVEVMSGNKLLPGMDPAAHCYCGHQFGNFAGQLGDGAVIYLGEVQSCHCCLPPADIISPCRTSGA